MLKTSIKSRTHKKHLGLRLQEQLKAERPLGQRHLLAADEFDTLLD